jgi:protoporphyrinogen oxidase
MFPNQALTTLTTGCYASDFEELSLERVWGPAVLAGLQDTQTVGVVTTNGQLCLTLTSRHLVPFLVETAIDIMTDQLDRK